MNYRALNTKTKIKSTEKGDKFFLYWKDKEIDELMGEGLPQQIMNKFKMHHFHKNILFVRIKRDTPIKSFIVYKGFSHWCSCG